MDRDGSRAPANRSQTQASDAALVGLDQRRSRLAGPPIARLGSVPIVGRRPAIFRGRFAMTPIFEVLLKLFLGAALVLGAFSCATMYGQTGGAPAGSGASPGAAAGAQPAGGAAPGIPGSAGA